MNPVTIFNFFDAITVAIMAPTIVLVVLVAAAAVTKNYFQLSSSTLRIAQAGQKSGRLRSDPRATYVLTNLSIHAVCLILFNALVLCAFPFYCAMNSQGINIAHLSVDELILETALSVLKPLLLTLPLFVFLQLVHAKMCRVQPLLQPASVPRLAISTLTFIIAALWLSPFIQAAIAYSGLAYGDLYMLRDVQRIAIALSTIPATALGLIIACFSMPCPQLAKAAKRLNAQPLSFESLCVLSEDELHELTEAALVTRNLEAGDILSQHLLERAEKQNVMLI